MQQEQKILRGIYIIKCDVTGDSYIGCSSDICKRWQQHITDLTLGNKIPNFQLLVQKYGIKSLSFKVLEQNDTFTTDELLKLEASYILDLNLENNYKEIKRLELEIQHGKDEKVKYDPIDFLVGIYRDVEEKKVLNIDEYSEFSGFNKKDLKNKLDEAKLMMEFLDYIDRPRRYHIAKELKMDGPLVEALNILKKIKDPVQKEKMKQQIFILIYSKDGNEDVGKKFIRPLNTIVNNPEAFKEYLEKTDSHRETTLEKIQEINDEVESYEVSKSYDESKKKFDEVSGTQKEEYSKVVENILIKIDAEKQQNTALVFLKKASGDIINIKEDHFILTTKDQEEEVLDKIKEIIYDLKNIEKMILKD